MARTAHHSAGAILAVHYQYARTRNAAARPALRLRTCRGLCFLGLSLVVLWDIDNGGSFGYYLNNASPLSLADPIKAGDHVKAYAFTDLETWSDTYCFFENDALEAIPGNISFSLYASGYDASWNPVTLPVADAVITVNGEATDCKTDAEGKAVLSIDQPGKYVISAVSETQNLVAPVCILTITEIK